MLTVVHTPTGQDHPYEQLPEERFPRHPMAGESFVVGAVTRPPGGAVSVTARASVNGGEPAAFAAVHQSAWRPEWEEGVGAEFLERIIRIEQDVWRAELSAPAHGETLTYTLEAVSADGDTAVCGPFTLRGEAWVEGGGWLLDGGQMRLSRTGSPVVGLPGVPPVTRIEWLTDGEKARRVRLSFASPADERFFGLGERFNALDQRGNVMDVRVYEQYKNQGQRTYLPVPFLLSSAGYGLWVQSTRWTQFDLAAASPDIWTLEADLGADETLDLKWYTGDDPFAISSQFTRETGPAALPPLWSFGLWMSANEWNSQARVEQEVKAAFAHDIPPSVVVIEAWSDETTFYIWNDAVYTPKSGAEAFQLNDFSYPADGRWPNPKGMTDWLHDQDVRLILWQIPALKRLEDAEQMPPHSQAQQAADHEWFVTQGYGVKDPDGKLHKIRPFWFRGGYIWDVTNPAARDWWLNKRAYLLDEVGVDGFKTDGGEHLWGLDVRFADGTSGADTWNAYPQLYTEAYYQFITARKESLLFSRAGYTGAQRSPSHWAGDENSNWDAFRHSILAGLSAGVSGVLFWGWDIGGFSGPIPTSELYLRGAAMAAFCPIMQLHSEYNANRVPYMDRTPWNMQERTGDERIIPAFRFFNHVRRNLMPYIWQEAQHSAQSGEPMMRAARLLDPAASDMQYFFGRDLLVCPVVEPDVVSTEVYLPAGVWADFWTGAVVEGGRTITVAAPLDRIPVYVRAGAVIPVRLPPGGKLGDAVHLSGEATGELHF
ncbi:MAG: glycoside hydrolase family 31 protein [Anaerolineae bacterium]